MLKLFVSGNIGSDAVIRDAGNGRSAISFSVATSKKIKQENVTTWVKCTKWADSDKTAIVDYLKKGVKVLVVGEASVDVYEGKGNLLCNVIEIELMGKNESVETAPQQVQPVNGVAEAPKVDLPF